MCPYPIHNIMRTKIVGYVAFILNDFETYAGEHSCCTHVKFEQVHDV